MPRNVRAESYWIDTSPETTYPPVDDGFVADVAIIGGGIAGLSTAWELLEAGRSVAVIEADRIAAGVTGYTTAKLSCLHTLIYDDLASGAGSDVARLYGQSQQDAIQHVYDISEQLGIDCDFEWGPAFTFAEDPRRVTQLRNEAAAAAKAGLAASFVTETGLPFPVAGAVRMDAQAVFHPRKYLLGLADAIVERGGVIFEGSRVTDLSEGAPCRLTTDTGAQLTATDVVVATHYPIFDRALLFPRLTPHRDLAIAAAIPENADPGGSYITPEHNTRSVRTAPLRPGSRLLIVTGEQATPGTGSEQQRYDTLLAWMLEAFPDAEPLYRWAAQDNSTSDHLPFIGRLHPLARHAYVATGFNSWGMSNGVVAGRVLAALLTGGSLPWSHIYDPVRLHPLREAVPLAKAQATVAKHFVLDRLHGEGVDSVDELACGAAAVLRVGGKKSAVYRDDDGTVHAVSAICTHLGCEVRFNDAERSWDCPCHGSRFAIDGSVLQGPATRPLRRRYED